MEAGIEQMFGRDSPAIGCSNNEKLHVVKCNVKADREPKRSGAQQAVAEQKANRDEGDNVPDVLVRLEEIMQRRKDERDHDRRRPEANALP